MSFYSSSDSNCNCHESRRFIWYIVFSPLTTAVCRRALISAAFLSFCGRARNSLDSLGNQQQQLPFETSALPTVFSLAWSIANSVSLSVTLSVALPVDFHDAWPVTLPIVLFCRIYGSNRQQMRKLFQSFAIDVMLKNFLNNTSKGSFRSRKTIVKVLFPSFAMWGSHGVGES